MISSPRTPAWHMEEMVESLLPKPFLVGACCPFSSVFPEGGLKEGVGVEIPQINFDMMRL